MASIAHAHKTPSQDSKVTTKHGQKIQVYLRVRPFNGTEKMESCVSVLECDRRKPKEVSLREKNKNFEFDRVFAPESKQADVYHTVAHPLVQQTLKGYNCTVFAYGQTGTGKTHTMEGFDGGEISRKNCNLGIIPRSLIEIFELRDSGKFDRDNFQVKVSFLELYNEEIFDLLAKDFWPDRKYKIFEDSNKKGSVIVQGLEEIVVENSAQVLSILQSGSEKRQTAATRMNANSSRSHTIFTITVTITDKSIVGQEKYIEGKLNLVDLAGSENIGRSGAVDKRAREAGKINESLLTLGRVINSLVKNESHVPYRESKLTRLLQDSLGGRTKTSIIATVSPAKNSLEETRSTLDYAQRAKNITNKPEVNQKILVASQIAEWQAKYNRIKKELDEQRERDGGAFISQEQKDTYDNQVLELLHLRKEMENLANLFDEKKTECEKFEEELEETLKELEEKSLILAKTQEEKEVQEFLVSKHQVDKEKSIKQESFIIEVADRQYNELQILHDVRDRKSNLERHNIQVSEKYQMDSSKRYEKLNLYQQQQINIAKKYYVSEQQNREKAVQIFDSTGRTMIDNAALMDSEVKELISQIDGLAASQMRSEETFHANTLKVAQTSKDDDCTKHQNFMMSSLENAQESESEIRKRQMVQDELLSLVRDHEEELQFSDLAYAQKQEELSLAADSKNLEHFLTLDAITNEIRDDVESIKRDKEVNHGCIEKQRKNIKKLKKNIEELQELLKEEEENLKKIIMVNNGLEEKEKKLNEKLQIVDKENQQFQQFGKTALKTQSEAQAEHKTHKQELGTNFLEKMNDYEKGMSKVCQEDLVKIDVNKGRVKSLVEDAQQRAQKQYDQLEVETKQKLEELSEILRNQQELSTIIVNKTHDLHNKAESLTESGNNLVREWNVNSDKEMDKTCGELINIGNINLELISEARSAQHTFFSKGQKRDVPSGKTPLRSNEPHHPKKPLSYTPDEERARRYRNGRGTLNAAMRLPIDNDDGEGSENDSVFSSSTNVTGSRRNSGMSDDSEEVDYASDRENSDPMFARPTSVSTHGSKLKAPKVYSQTNISTRSRSSSRNRNVLAPRT